MAESINTVVIGAGVVGLACARALSADGRDVIVIDRNDGIGQETSSRNSEVIHAGIYYPTGSQKAQFCVSGKRALYDYCDAKGIAYKRIGKLIVATDANDSARLEQLRDQAARNGVNDLQWLSPAEITELEPSIRVAAGLLSPSTGIIDTHELMLAMRADIEAASGSIAARSQLVAVRETDAGKVLTIESDDESTELTAANVVNCAGLHASTVAALLHGDDAIVPQTYYARGVYFEYAERAPFSRLIYPLPEPGGLGVHATLDMSGALRFGPDVEWIDELDYSVDPARGAAFFESIMRWWPDVDADKLRPAYAGIRPKLSRPGEPPADFLITQTHTASGCVVDLLGIESPGLTSALAIASHVNELFR